MAKKSKKIKTVKSRSIENVFLTPEAKRLYKDYAVHVIEDRAIYGEIDGLKPSTRRALWSTHKLGLRHNARHEKSAKVVGDAIGSYHPHGTEALYGAIVTAANLPMKLFDGDGNFGTMSDPPAAMRYTNVRLSAYSDKTMFDKFYLAVADMVPNYDDSTVEPLVLPSLLPNALLNGNFGIAPGVRTQTPSYTLKSLVPVIVKYLKQGELKPRDCLSLEFTTEYGGVLRKTEDTKRELLSFYKTGSGKFTFDSVYKDVSSTEIRFNQFAPFSNIETVLSRVESIKGVKNTRDDSDKHDPYLKAYVVGFPNTLKGKERDSVIDKVVDAFSSNVSFDVKTTLRQMSDTKAQGEKKLKSTNTIEMIESWVKYRIGLEKRACKYWIGKRKQEIAYLALLILAVKSRKFIIKALDKKLSDEELAKYIAKGLKITIEQANTILDLKIRQLKRLEETSLKNKIKALKEEIAGYNQRIQKPKSYIAKQIVGFMKELSA